MPLKKFLAILFLLTLSTLIVQVIWSITDVITNRGTDRVTKAVVYSLPKSNGFASPTLQPAVVDNLKLLAKTLMEAQWNYYSSPKDYQSVGKQIEILKNILEALNISATAPVQEQMPRRAQEVCPEEYKGKKLHYDFPLFRKGFGRVDCKEFVPIEKLVTLLISMPKELDKPTQSYLDVLEKIAKYYGKIRVILATEEHLNDNVKSSVSKLDILFENDVMNGVGQSALWKRLVDKVTTPYVLIAEGITHFDDDIDLERLVRVLSYEPDVLIAAGSHRNLKGEWDMGCQQIVFQNWTATYQGGYYRSFNECVVCDYVSGPFMARTATLKEFSFDPQLKFGVFHDLFWRMKIKIPGKIFVSCPDVMFNIQDREIRDEEYVGFANKHDIHKLVEANGRVRWYGCRSGYSHTSKNLCGKAKAGIGLSPASMETLADAVKCIMKYCQEAGAFCELAHGTALGAVKFNGVLPWEVDSDIAFLPANFSVIKGLAQKLQQHGYRLRVRSLPTVDSGGEEGKILGAFEVSATPWTVELLGIAPLGSHNTVALGRPPTKVMYAGQWVNFARNPGRYVRNHYGTGVYQHQEHWRNVGRKSSWLFYQPGSFMKCPSPGHSACLDQYPADGNMVFRGFRPQM